MLSALGGGGSLFGDIDYVVYDRVVLGLRICCNLLKTKNLAFNDTDKIWSLDELNNRSVHLDFSGISVSFHVGLLR